MCPKNIEFCFQYSGNGREDKNRRRLHMVLIINTSLGSNLLKLNFSWLMTDGLPNGSSYWFYILNNKDFTIGKKIVQ